MAANVDGGGNGSNSWSVDGFTYLRGDVDGGTEGLEAACSMGMVAPHDATPEADSKGGSSNISLSNQLHTLHPVMSDS